MLTVAVWNYDDGPRGSHIAVTIATGLVAVIMLMLTVGVRFRSPRRALLLRTVGAMLTVVSFGLLAFLAIIDATPLFLTLAVGTLMLVVLLACYMVYQGAETSARS